MKKLRENLAGGIIVLGAVVLILSLMIVGVIIFVGYSIYYKSYKVGYNEAKNVITNLLDQI